MAKGSAAATPLTVVKGKAVLPEYSFVRLSHTVEAGGISYPMGAQGVIVHRHSDGIGYEVEFERPRFRVITLTASDFVPDHE
jgi:hypothetical protein